MQSDLQQQRVTGLEHECPAKDGDQPARNHGIAGTSIPSVTVETKNE